MNSYPIAALFISLASSASLAAEETPRPVAAGYDVVAYQTENNAIRGTGYNVSVHTGETYLFASKENKAG